MRAGAAADQLGGVTGRLRPAQRRARALQRPERLLQRLGKGPPDRHRLADRLHVRGQDRVGAGELLKRESRHLDDHVVERWLEARRGLAGDVVANLVQGVADREPRRDLGDREAGCLRRQRAGPGHPGVHLDHDHAAGARVDRELDVAAAGVHPDGAGGRDRDVAHVLVLAVGQGHRRGHRDRVAGVHAHRVNVLDRANDDHVVVAVAHQLELELLPAEDRLLEQHLGDRAGIQPGPGDPAQLTGVVGDARPQAAQGERGPHHQRVAEFGRCLLAIGDRVADEAPRHLSANLGDDLLEPAPVLAGPDRLDVGADQLDAVAGQRARLVQRDRRVERRLAAQRGQHRVRPLLRDHLLQYVQRDRLHVGRVGELGVGHDRRRVGVRQDHPVTLGAQHPAGLGTRVVELAGLSDHDRAGTDHQHRLQVGPPRHGPAPSGRRSRRTGPRRRACPAPPRGGTAR